MAIWRDGLRERERKQRSRPLWTLTDADAHSCGADGAGGCYWRSQSGEVGRWFPDSDHEGLGLLHVNRS